MLQQDMGQRFGYDFSRVRVHTGTAAEQSAQEVNAKAYTVGHNIVFGEGQFAPGSHTGRHLLVHELTHVVQQSGTDGISADQRNDKRGLSSISTQLANQAIPKLLARKKGCEKGHPLGANVKPPLMIHGKEITYRIWGTWQKGDSITTFVDRTFQLWIKWRFNLSAGKEFDAVLAYMKNNFSPSSGGSTPDAGCQAFITMDNNHLAEIRKLSGEVAREKAATENKVKADAAAKSEPSGTEGGENTIENAKVKVEGDKSATSSATNKDKEAKPGQGGGSIGGFGFLNDAVKEATALDQMPSERIKSDITVLKDSVLSNKYLQLQEHYTGRSISAADRTAASDGLDAKEIESIEDGKPMRRAITALFTQGWREFTAAGESDKEKFMLLEQLICEQFTRGNPTATHNQMKIGKGVPENTFGIVERGTNILLYNDLGVPRPGFGGVGFRDRGYIASRADYKFGFNIANVKNPGLRSLLNSLRQTFGDPFRMAIGGAEMYFKHINAVNEKVLTGLSKEVIQKFEDMLPYFVGFLAGHAVSTFLMRVPNPYVAGVGLSLKALLVGAGYIMDIDFGPGALERLMLAAAFLSKFEENDKHELSELSQDNLNAAAKIIQDMVAEIAVMFATAALGKLVSRAHAGKERFKVECTHCDLDGPGAPEAKMKTEKAESKGETGKIEAGKTVETPKTEQQIAVEKVEQLKQQKAKIGGDLTALRARREALRKARNQAVLDKKAAVDKMDKATTKEGKESAMAEAREALARQRKAERELENYPTEEELHNNLKKLESEIGVESIKADPKSRGKLPCFAAGTLVLTPHGARPIESLMPNDEVWAWDFARESAVVGRVAQLHRGCTQRWVDIRSARGSIRATLAHRFFVYSSLEWLDAESLRPGMQLLMIDASPDELQCVKVSEIGRDEETFNLSIDSAGTYFVGPGWLVHNEAVDIGLGSNFIIYRATNPKFPGKVYIGQTTELNAQGKPRGVEERQGEHQNTAQKKLEADLKGTEKLSASHKEFYEFMREAKLETVVKGISTKAQADYLEQHNIDIEERNPQVEVMNRRNQITSENHMKKVVEEITNDPTVKGKGYCP
jgi:hypothetical protein